MSKTKVALVTLGDTRKEFYKKREHIASGEIEKAKEAFGEKYDLWISEIVFTFEEACRTAAHIREEGISAVLIHLPIWATPSLAFQIAYSVDSPVVLLGNLQKDTSSLVTLLAVGGMLDQAGKTCIRISGDFRDQKIQDEVDVFVRAVSLSGALSSSCFGMIGGRSIGIGTTVMDPSQWKREFGVEFDHCDQYEIVYRAQALDRERVDRHLAWVRKFIPKICFGGRFTEESLEKQVRSYLALKDMAAEKNYSFMGIKCQQDMSDHFVLQCLGVALLNNDYDADGDKKPVPTSCECDSDGALTMFLLNTVSGGLPSCLVDIKFFGGEDKEFVLANCGSVAPHFADPHDRRAAGEKICMMEHIFGEAGGGSIQMIADPGDVTVARLFRSNGRYVLGCFEGHTKMYPLEKLKETTFCYPHAFVEADVDCDLFYRRMNSNHLHLVYGKYARVLELFCRIRGIDFINFGRNAENA